MNLMESEETKTELKTGVETATQTGSRTKLKAVLRFIPMVIMMVIIFFFSTMQGDESSETSGVFLKALTELVEGISKKALDTETLGALHIIIRKLAHFTEYAMLGVAIMYAIWYKWNSHRFPYLLPELIAMAYATTDEIHQYFVPGRYGTWSDVLIDSCGAAFGILLYYLVWKRKTEKPTEKKN